MVIDLSVIVLTYNTCLLTQRCLQSIEANPATPYTVETVVVDNASTDGTATMLNVEFPSARIVRNAQNKGFARGNNAGLAVAQGRYLMLLNSDTEVMPGALARLVRFMDDHPDAGACGPMLLNADGTLQPSGRNLPSLWSVFLDMTRLYRLWKRDLYFDPRRRYDMPAKIGELSGAALLVRRTCYDQVGGLDPVYFAYYEDVDWCKRIGNAQWAIYYVPAAQIIHLWQGTSRQVPERAYRAGQDSLRYYFRKHHGRLSSYLVQAMLAGKEILRMAGCCVRNDRAGVLFHKRALRVALAPLESSR